MKFRFSLAAASLLALSALTTPIVSAQDQINGGSGSDRDTPAHGRGNYTRNRIGHAAQGGAVVTGNGISYHNGPVMHGNVNVYFIWYGNWNQDPKASGILTAWANNIGGSPYEAINTTYGDNTGNVSGAVTLAGSTSSTLSLGTSLSDSDIASIVSNTLGSSLPIDPNGVYFVLTAPGVAETSGFISQYCGWHTYGMLGTTPIKYAFVGDAAGPSLGNCAEQTNSSPNGDPAVDAMVSVMAHELEEAASDPQLNAWYDSRGEENADKCAWTFGTTYHASNGSLANVKLGGQDYLIQQNWLNANGGYCTMSYSATPDFSLSASPTSQTVMAGGTTGAYSVTATPLNGWSGTVNYTVTSGLPSGASAQVSGNLITIVTSSTTPGGTYVFTISGNDPVANLTRTTTATLVVTQPSFSLGISPSSNTVHRPGSATYIVTITPQPGFTGNVTLSASPNRTGLSYAFSQNPDGTWTLTATATNSAKRGNVTITVTGTSGNISKSATASLQIQ